MKYILTILVTAAARSGSNVDPNGLIVAVSDADMRNDAVVDDILHAFHSGDVGIKLTDSVRATVRLKLSPNRLLQHIEGADKPLSEKERRELKEQILCALRELYPDNHQSGY